MLSGKVARPPIVARKSTLMMSYFSGVLNRMNELDLDHSASGFSSSSLLTYPRHSVILFEDAQGGISYELEGIGVTGPFRFDDKTAADIVIQREMTFRRETQAPVKQVEWEQIGCLCYYAGNVEFITKVPRTGYCVVDEISLTVDIENGSTKVIKMEAEIVQKIVFFVYSHDYNSIGTVASVSSDPISPGDTVTWSPDNLVVPAVPPTLEGCRIINVEYELLVVAILVDSLDPVCNMMIPLFLSTISHTNSLGQVVLERVLLPLLRQSLAAGQTAQTPPTNSQAAVSPSTHTTSVPLQTASNDYVDDHPYNFKESDTLL